MTSLSCDCHVTLKIYAKYIQVLIRRIGRGVANGTVAHKCVFCSKHCKPELHVRDAAMQPIYMGSSTLMNGKGLLCSCFCAQNDSKTYLCYLLTASGNLF